MSAPRSDSFSTVDGTRLAIHRIGEGYPVVLLYGLFSSAVMNWIKWGHADRLTDAGYEAIMLDFRVHGDSESPRDPAKYPQNVLVRDALALIEHLGVEDYVLGGFSLGARTSLHAVAEGILSPQKLIVGGMGVAGLSEWNRRSAYFKRVIDEFDSIGPGDPAYYSRQFLKSQGVDRVAARLLLDSMTDLETSLLGNVTMPTLVVCGEEDEDNGSASDLAELLPDASYKEVPGNHLMSATKPEMGEAIVEWLRVTE